VDGGIGAVGRGHLLTRRVVPPEDDDGPVIASLVLVGLVLSAALSGGSRVGGVVVLAASSVLWLLVNGPMEGPILVTVTPGHGVTGADLAGFTGLALAGRRLLVLGRRAADPG
jgi:hypothetical protein